jgi:hypothetical protein
MIGQLVSKTVVLMLACCAVAQCAAFATEITTGGEQPTTDELREHVLSWTGSGADFRWTWDAIVQSVNDDCLERLKSLSLPATDTVRIDVPKDEHLSESDTFPKLTRSGLLNCWFAKGIPFCVSIGGKETRMTVLAIDNYDGFHKERDAVFSIDGARTNSWATARKLLNDIQPQSRILLILVPWKIGPSSPPYMLPGAVSRELPKLRKAGMEIIVCQEFIQ